MPAAMRNRIRCTSPNSGRTAASHGGGGGGRGRQRHGPAPLPLLPPPLASPVPAAFLVLPLHPIDHFLRVERHAAGRGAFLRRVRFGDEEHHRDVDENADAFRQQREDDEADANERDVDLEVRGEAAADARDHRAVGDAVEALRRRRGRGGGAALRFRSVGAVLLASARPRSRGDRAHLRDDLRHFGGGDHRLVRAEIPLALVGDRLLEIRHDFGPIRVVLELPIRACQILAQGVVAAFLELIGVAVQIDADDFLHGYRPSCEMVAFRCFQ